MAETISVYNYITKERETHTIPEQVKIIGIESNRAEHPVTKGIPDIRYKHYIGQPAIIIGPGVAHGRVTIQTTGNLRTIEIGIHIYYLCRKAKSRLHDKHRK